MKPLMIFACVVAVATAQSVMAQTSDAAIKQKIIERSIANYDGSCPCPYNVARNGSRCGGRSAYSRPGGASPRCYPEDISRAEVEAYRHR